MTRVSHLVLITSLVSCIGGLAVAQGPKSHSHGSVQANDSASTKDFKEAHGKMMKGMDIAYTGNADVDFVRGMIPHHQGAIDMAKVQLKHGKDQETRTLAQKIIADQEKEIEQMQAWLKKSAK
jgi:uncharacterized protein (DUF305 family)